MIQTAKIIFSKLGYIALGGMIVISLLASTLLLIYFVLLLLYGAVYLNPLITSFVLSTTMSVYILYLNYPSVFTLKAYRLTFTYFIRCVRFYLFNLDKWTIFKCFAFIIFVLLYLYFMCETLYCADSLAVRLVQLDVEISKNIREIHRVPVIGEIRIHDTRLYHLISERNVVLEQMRAWNVMPIIKGKP